MKHKTAKAIFHPRLLAQKLSQRTNVRIPKVIRVKAPRIWAIIGASLGKQKERTNQKSPTPRVNNELQRRVSLKF